MSSTSLALKNAPNIADDPSAKSSKQSAKDDERAGRMILDWQYLFGLRGNWNSHWTEIAQRILPMDSWLFQNFSQLNMQGDKRNFELYDSTGAIALQRFGAILDSLLTPRDQFWSQIRPTDDRLLKDKATRVWYEKANNILFRERYAPTSNFAAQNQQQYLSLGAYGTGVLFIDRLSGSRGIRYKNVHLGECYLQENHQGIVDRVCRHFMLTARQAFLKFGDRCPDNILAVLPNYPDRQFFFLHWVMPNDELDPERKDFKGMAYTSAYVSIEGRKIVEESGYHDFPYAISRYYQAANEAYGRSVAMDVLPTLKTLNEMKKAMLKQGHRVLDPVLIAANDGILDGFSLQPGALNAGGVTADGKLLVHALPTGEIQAGKEVMDDERELIKDSFLINIFQILTENPQQTATEVLERAREKGILLAPTIGRQQSEYLGPMSVREIDLLSQQGMLPPMTPAMKEAKGEFKTVYDSPITRTQKSEWAAGAQRTIEVAMNLAQTLQDPSYMFYIDADEALPAIAAINGTPASWMRTKEQVAALKAAHAKQMQMQQAVQAAPAVAGVMKAHAAMNKGGPTGGNPAGNM